MTNVLPLRPTQMAEHVDPDTKAFATARARCALLGAALYRRIDDDGTTTFSIGLRKFESIAQVEDYLDTVDGDGAPP